MAEYSDKLLEKQGVYIITNTVDMRLYPGSTIRPFKERFEEHKNMLRKNKHYCTHLQNFVNKYGIDTLLFRPLEILTPLKDKKLFQKEALKKEQRYLDIYKSTGLLFNSAENALAPMEGKHHTSQAKKKISEKNKGKIVSKETRMKMSDAKKGTKIPETVLLKMKETRKNNPFHPTDAMKKHLSLLRKGIPRSKDVIEKMRLGHIGKKLSDDHKRKIKEIHSKKVLQYSLEGKFLRCFKSIVSARAELGLGTSHISSVCRGEKKSAGGFMWRLYKEGEIITDIPPLKKRQHNIGKVKVVQFDLNDNFIKKYSSVTEAAQENNLFGTSITATCRGKYKTCGKSKWKYVDD
jgi:group I intron endonuclease